MHLARLFVVLIKSSVGFYDVSACRDVLLITVVQPLAKQWCSETINNEIMLIKSVVNALDDIHQFIIRSRSLTHSFEETVNHNMSIKGFIL